MLKVNYTAIQTPPAPQIYQAALLTLPQPMQLAIAAYKNPMDRYLQVSCKLLLRELIHEFKLDTTIGLGDVAFCKNGKPHFNNLLYFSNAHAGSIAICAATKNGDIGIDVEKISPIYIAPYQEYFTLQEWDSIHTGENVEEHFLDAWTKKEAVLKASGLGVNIDLASFDVTDGVTTINNITYYTHKLALAEGYICHVASQIPELDIKLKEVNVFGL